ncbi:MAG: carboxypeptidase-like regulatory domain-containing protein [Candidatus Acidiferrales bacterium]
MTSRVRACFSRNEPSQNHNSVLSAAVLRALVFLSIVGFSCATTRGARAQDQGPELRTVHGTVIDAAENPVTSAVVYLKNMKTQDVKTYITREDGLYRFSGLDPNVDYQVYAEHNGMVSSTREVSSYDSRRDINFQLKLSHKKAST